jgi:hypothetical protein
LKNLTLGIVSDIFVLVYIYTLQRLVRQDEECVKYLLKTNKQIAEILIVEINKAVTDKMIDDAAVNR